MTIKECYDVIGADYQDAQRRLRSDQLLRKFMLKFLDDKSFERLRTALKEGDMPEAFRAAHTLKGICQNLSFTQLGKSSEALTERLRHAETYSPDMQPLFEAVEADYGLVIAGIRQLQ
jgi:HPt (histidine-containing phosphotransfer) domain-containing protein